MISTQSRELENVFMFQSLLLTGTKAGGNHKDANVSRNLYDQLAKISLSAVWEHSEAEASFSSHSQKISDTTQVSGKKQR